MNGPDPPRTKVTLHLLSLGPYTSRVYICILGSWPRLCIIHKLYIHNLLVGTGDP